MITTIERYKCTCMYILHILVGTVQLQQWDDDSLGWDPSDYNSIKSVRIPAINVWLPDTFIYNK